MSHAPIPQGSVTGGQYESSGPFGAGFCSDFTLPHCHHHGPVGNDPYPSEGAPGCMSQQSPKCPRTCGANATGDHSTFASDKYTFEGKMVTASGETAIKQMIMEGGPVETAFTVYSDFENYVRTLDIILTIIFLARFPAVRHLRVARSAICHPAPCSETCPAKRSR